MLLRIRYTLEIIAVVHPEQDTVYRRAHASHFVHQSVSSYDCAMMRTKLGILMLVLTVMITTTLTMAA